MFLTEMKSVSGELAGSRLETSRSVAFSAESAAGIAHDLGNLIQIASSAVNIVARHPRVYGADLEPILTGAKTSLERAGALVKMSLRTVQQRSAPIEHVNLAIFLADVESLTTVTWHHSVRVDVQVSADLPPVTCDPQALHSAVLNLLLNARDAMPDGGLITVHAEVIMLESGAAAVEIRVADTGVGMAPETIDRAFEPFFTTKPDGLGGVGLPMVQRFAEEARGRILIKSELGVGTTVALQLPASTPSPGSSSESRG